MKLGIVKKFIFFYVNLASILWLLLDQRLAAFYQLFSWILKLSDQQNDCKAIWQSEQFSHYHVYKPRTLSQKIFCNWINFWIKHSKIFHCSLSKISLHYQTVIDQRLTVLHPLFSWTSVRVSKYPMDKMIGSLGHLTVWGVPRVWCVPAKNSFTEKFFEMNKFSNWTL